jgi:membrane protease YdiL (CAAX protease family)
MRTAHNRAVPDNLFMQHISFLQKREYNLPGQFPMRFAIVATIIYLALPSWWFLPLSEIYGIGMIIYCVKKYPGLDKLGLERPLTPKAKKAIFMILIGAATLFIILIVLVIVDRTDPTSNQTPFHHQVKYPYSMWPPDDKITDAFSHRDLKRAILYSIKPFILLGLLAPIFETIFVFGMTFPALFKRFGYSKAFWWLTIIFVLSHLTNAANVVSLSLVFISSAAMSILYAETRSLFPSIALHICYNSLIYSLYFVINWGRAKG